METVNPLVAASFANIIQPASSPIAATLSATQKASKPNEGNYLNLRDIFYVLKHDRSELSTNNVDDTELPKNCFLAYDKDPLTLKTDYTKIHPAFLSQKIVAFRGVPLYVDYGLRLAGGENGPLCFTIGTRINGTLWKNNYPITNFIYYASNNDGQPDPALTTLNTEVMGSRGETCHQCVSSGHNTTEGSKGEVFKCSSRGRLLLAVFEVGVLQNRQVKDAKGLSVMEPHIVWQVPDALEGMSTPFCVLMESSAGVLYDSKSRPLADCIRSVSYLPSSLMTFRSLTTHLSNIAGENNVIKVTPSTYPDHPEVYLHNTVMEFYAAPLSNNVPTISAYHRYFPLFRMCHPNELAMESMQYVQIAWAYYVCSIDAFNDFRKTGVMNNKWSYSLPDVSPNAPDHSSTKDINNLVNKLKVSK